MRLLRVKWGKMLVEVPTEIILCVLLKAFLMLHKLNV
jgi:hypothetical protein